MLGNQHDFFLIFNMASKLKVFILIIVFVIPVLLFLFLKFFGSNTFEIPVISESIDCVEISSLKKNSEPILIINNQTEGLSDAKEDKNQIRRVLERFGSDAGITFVVSASDSSKYDLVDKYDIGFRNDQVINDCMKTYAGAGSKILLVDKQNQLRGTYTVERSGIDRLFMEVDILKLETKDIVRR